MKDKNKKKCIWIGIIVLLILFIIAIITILNIKEENNINSESIQHGEIEYDEVNKDNNNLDPTEQTFIIKSSTENPIEKDNIEIIKMEIISRANELQITTTLKNKTKEILNGFLIEINLLDKDGNIITNIAENSSERINANGEFTFNSYVVDLPNDKAIVSAEIESIEKNNIQEEIEGSFEEMDKQGNNLINPE